MKTLDRKLLRDLRLMWSQALTIALAVASGVGGSITSFSAFDSLSWSRDVYYAESRFADVFATLKSAPLALERQLGDITGAAHGSGAIQALVSEAFAEAHKLKLGDEITALINGKLERLRLVGTGLSPEYVFASLGGSPDSKMV